MVWLPTKPDPPVTRIVLHPIAISLLNWMRGEGKSLNSSRMLS